jgi:hypothetical protein
MGSAPTQLALAEYRRPQERCWQSVQEFVVRCLPCSTRGRQSVLAELTQCPSQAAAENGARDLRDRYVAPENWPQWETRLLKFCAEPGGWWLRPLRRGETVYGIVHSPVMDSRKLLVGDVLAAMKSGRRRLPPTGEWAYPLMTRRQVMPLKCSRCRHTPRPTTAALLDLIRDAQLSGQTAVYV